MDKVFAVIRREFLERVRTRAFLIGTLLVPLMMFGFGILPSILLRKDSRTRTVVVLDATSDGTGTAVRDALDSLRLNTGDGETRRYALYLANLGRGMKPTREEHGLGLIWLAALLRSCERRHAPPALLTLRERLTRHPGGRFSALG